MTRQESDARIPDEGLLIFSSIIGVTFGVATAAEIAVEVLTNVDIPDTVLALSLLSTIVFSSIPLLPKPGRGKNREN